MRLCHHAPHDADGKTSGGTHRAAQREPRLPAAAPSARRRKTRRGFSGRHRRARRAGSGISKSFARSSNVIARLLPQNKIRQTILLAPHLDTVGADGTQFIPQRKNGRLHGRGACDTKGSVAAMLTALCELAESNARPPETEIFFAGLIDEENAQAGSRALAASGSRRLWPSSANRPSCGSSLRTRAACGCGWKRAARRHMARRRSLVKTPCMKWRASWTRWKQITRRSCGSGDTSCSARRR